MSKSVMSGHDHSGDSKNMKKALRAWCRTEYGPDWYSEDKHARLQKAKDALQSAGCATKKALNVSSKIPKKELRAWCRKQYGNNWYVTSKTQRLEEASSVIKGKRCTVKLEEVHEIDGASTKEAKSAAPFEEQVREELSTLGPSIRETLELLDISDINSSELKNPLSDCGYRAAHIEPLSAM